MKMFRFCIPIVIVFISACGSTDPDGGPCTYTIDTIPATIVSIDTNESAYPEIRLAIKNMEGKIDTFRYAAISDNGDSPSTDIILKRGYVIGSQLNCKHEVRTSGHCDPEIFVLHETFYGK